jgi:hypothetical protein
MEKKELRSMKRHRGVILGLALSALMGLWSSRAQAETITMTIQVGTAGPVVDLSTFGGVGTAQGYTMDAAAITSLNLFLSTSGSQYQFSTTGATTLGGTSNHPGSDAQGQLTLGGTILSVGAGEARLTLTETEDMFTAPTGPAGTLMSSSTGNFSGQPSGGGHSANSSFNGTPASSLPDGYSVLSSGTAPNPQGGSASVGLAPVPTLYTLTNTIVFGLSAGTTANPIVDGFSVIATVQAVPEPASLVMMLTGIPIPLVVLGMLRRRQASA